MINKKKRIIKSNMKKGGVNSSFYFILVVPERSRGVHVNESVTSDIYFMYNYFFEKMG